MTTNEPKTPIDQIKLFRESLLALGALLGLFGGIIGFFLLVGAHPYLAAAVALLGFWLVDAYFFWKKTPSHILGAQPRAFIAVHPRLGRAITLGMFLPPVGLIAIYCLSRFLALPLAQELVPGQITLLVAPFDGPDKDYGVTETIVSRLRHAVRQYPDLKITTLSEPLTGLQDHTAARHAGEEKGASIVIWGWYRKTNQRAYVDMHVELLHAPRTVFLRDETRTLLLPAGELDSFRLQNQLATETSHLALTALALARYEADDYNGAIERFTNALSQPPMPDEMIDTNILYLFRGNSYSFLGDYDKAIADFDHLTADAKLAETLPDGVASAYINRALVYMNKTAYQRAITDFEKAVGLRPKTAFIRSNLGVAYFRSHDDKKAIDAFDKAIEIEPTHKWTYINRGHLYLAQNRFDLALADYTRAAAIDPSFAEAWYMRGVVYHEQARYADALREYDEAIRLQPDFARAHYSRGKLFFDMKRLEEAVSDQTKAIELNPHFKQAYTARGHVYLEMKRNKEAIDDFKAAAGLNPSSEELSNLGASLARAGSYQLAIQEYDEAIKLQPNSMMIYYNRAIAKAKLNDIEGALTDCEQAIKLKPEFPDVYLHRGNLFEKSGQHERAIADFTKALSLKPGFLNALVARALLLSDINRVKDAIEDASALIRLYPEDAKYYALRASLHERAGDTKSAIADHKKVRDLSQDPMIRASSEKRLLDLEGK